MDVEWRDLVSYRRREVVKELLLPVVWLALFFAAAISEYYLVALICSFYFFLTALRVSHNAFHYALGLPKAMTDVVMFVFSGIMLGALHAIQFTHLKHHRHCLGEQDVEGRVALQSFWQVILKGPWFPVVIHRDALRNAPRGKRRWIHGEMLLNAVILWVVFFVFDVFALQLHYALMLLAYCLSAFFAVWTVHRSCRHGGYPARTLRGWLKNQLFFNMFFHLEHHLFPAVPTCHLPTLAKRLDEAGVERYEHVF